MLFDVVLTNRFHPPESSLGKNCGERLLFRQNSCAHELGFAGSEVRFVQKKERKASMRRGQGLNSKFKYSGSPWGGLGTMIQTVFSLGVFFLLRTCPCGPVLLPPLE